MKNLNINENILYYFLILIITILFLKSINFNIKNFIQSLRSFLKFFLNKNTKNYTNKNEVINEYIPQDEIKNLIQEDLPFIKAEKNKKIKFELPTLDLLQPTKKIVAATTKVIFNKFFIS